MNKGDTLYYARIIPQAYLYEVCEIKIRTVEDDWFVGTEDRTKQAFYFTNKSINKDVFYERSKALKKVKEAEKNKIKIQAEIYYEEY